MLYSRANVHWRSRDSSRFFPSFGDILETVARPHREESKSLTAARTGAELNSVKRDEVTQHEPIGENLHAEKKWRTWPALSASGIRADSLVTDRFGRDVITACR